MQPRKAMYLEFNIEVRSHYHCYRGKAVAIRPSKWLFVALVIQHEERMCSIVLSTVACRVLPYSSTFSHEWQYFPKKNIIKYKERVLIFFMAFVWKIFRRDRKIAKSGY